MGWSRWRRGGIIEIEQGVGRSCKKSMGPKQDMPYEEQLKEVKILSGEGKTYEDYDSLLHL